MSDQEVSFFRVEEPGKEEKGPVYYVVALLDTDDPAVVQFTHSGFTYFFGNYGDKEAISKSPQEFLSWLIKGLNGKNQDQLSAIRNYLSLKFNIVLT
jgi:hypothetical protein